MNAKNYGVPQNRERVFTMSIKRQNTLIDQFVWPEPQPLKTKLKDVLEKEPSQEFYLTEDRVASLVASTEKERAKGNGFAFKPNNGDIAKTICTLAGSRKTDNFLAEEKVEIIDDIYNNRPERHYEKAAPTLRADRQGL
jgi:DNA (cytosine-5)-methyltransferase 1